MWKIINARDGRKGEKIKEKKEAGEAKNE